MPASDPVSSMTVLIAEASDTAAARSRRRERVIEAWDLAPEIPDAIERGLRRRARRQALALMIASSLASILALYGVWTLLRVVT